MPRAPITIPVVLALGIGLAAAAPAGQVPDVDRRNVEIRHTDFKFSFEPPANRRRWLERKQQLRQQVLFSAGLLPMPEKTPLNPQVFDRLERDGYSIEKVLLETWPGFYLGANLYRPTGESGPYPAVVSPHGHWRYGRFENSALNSVPGRAINLARQGYVVLTYDMIGYSDTRQLPHEALGGKREDLWAVNPLGVQLWNSIRAVDFLQSLSDVDPKRIAATGASGGATQVFLLTAVDDRIGFAAPVNMVSFLMQGGSVCENAPNLRIGTNNVEIAAMMAPKPLLMVSATGDWSRNIPTEELPAVRKVYDLFNAGDQVEAIQFDAPHNYHQGSREAVYRFFGAKILGDSDPEHFAEQSLSLPFVSDLVSLWNRGLPEGAVDAKTFVEQRISEADAAVDSAQPTDAASLLESKKRFRQLLESSLTSRLPAPNDLVSDLLDELPSGEQLVIGRRGEGDRIPAVLLRPRKPAPLVKPTLIVHPEGSSWALSSSESRSGFVSGLLTRGGAVMAIDAFQTGRVVVPRDIAGAGRRAEQYFTTFQRTDTANRVRDILTAITYARTRLGSQELHLVCPGEAGLWCGLASALAGPGIHLAADWKHFDGSDQALVERLFVPGLRKAGDFRAAATLWPAGSVLAWNAGDGFPIEWARASFAAAGAAEQLDVRTGAVSFEELLDRIAPAKRR